MGIKITKTGVTNDEGLQLQEFLKQIFAFFMDEAYRIVVTTKPPTHDNSDYSQVP